MSESIAALLEQATPEAATRLQELAEAAEDKAARKAARRALYLLSLQGVRPVESLAPTMEPETEPETGLRAYASAFDGAGNRLLFFTLLDPDGGSPTLVFTLLNDLEGVVEYAAERMSRAAVAERLQKYEVALSDGLAFAEIDSDYGRWLLEQARAIHQQQRRPTPRGFLEWAERIGPPRRLYERPVVYARLEPETIRGDLTLSRSPSAFFAQIWFEPWFFAVEEVLPWLRQLQAQEQSVLEVPEAVKAERRERVFVEALKTLMTPELRRHYIFRLEESAEILRRRGEETAAKQALYQALELAEEKPIEKSEFARALLERTILAALELIREAQEEAAKESQTS